MRLVVFLLAVSIAVYCQAYPTDDSSIQTLTCRYQAPYPRVNCFFPSLPGWRWIPPLPEYNLPPEPRPFISIPVNDNFS
ncbi:hypothetical protein V3C99_010152 [Haemonchus contortus]